MSEKTMIERVAVAICAVNYDDPDHSTVNDEPTWAMYVEDAKAAIGAMRTPTDAMIAAGGGETRIVCLESDAADIYSTMINAALNEPSNTGGETE
jgi:hypothetical protein